MIRRLTYLILVAAVFFAPVKRVNVASLEPVEALLLTQKGEDLTVTADTGYSGTGETISRAMEHLQENTPGLLYLDTLEYVALTPDTQGLLPGLQPFLKRRITVIYLEEDPPEDWADHLRKKNP